MKRGLSIVFIIVILLAVAALAGPALIDWNKYKPQIVDQVKLSAGYDIRIDGDISLSVLPLPQLKIEGLSVAAPRGREPNLLSMKEAFVSVNLMPLLSGNISVNTVRLVSPDIKLEKLADGSNSWMSDKLLAPNEDKEAGVETQPSGEKSDIALNKLTIEDGRVSYIDRVSGGEYLIEKINTDVAANTLTGPFKADGTLFYKDQKIDIDLKADKISGDKKESPIDLKIGIGGDKGSVAFKGVIATAPLEIQGKTEIKTDNLGELLALSGGTASPALAQKLSFSGLVTANEAALSSQEMDVEFGDAKGKGNLKVSNLKDKNPVKIEADMALEGMINLDKLTPGTGKRDDKSVEEKVARGEKLSANAGLIPETLSLPFPVDVAIRVTADGVETNGKSFKGIVADISMTGGNLSVNGKALDMPGKTSAEVRATIAYKNSSKSGETGVTYADPDATFTATGSSGQLPTLLRAFAPEQDGNEALEIWKTATFDLTGAISPASVSLKDSTLKLDQTSVALNGSYRPQGAAGRPDVVLDLTTDTVDIDYIQSRLNGQKKAAVQKDDTKEKADVKKTLQPLRDFNVPMNLTFDISAQNAIYNGQPIKGVRLKGIASGQNLRLENASVQDYMGAEGSIKGAVGNLAELSGVDLRLYGKTANLKALMQSLKMDTSKLPQSVSDAEANIAAKGTADALSFDANIAAVGGEVKASGNMTGLLGKPSFSNLTLGASHPNFVKAIQIVNPGFAGGPGLERPFDLYTKAVSNGDVYDLSDLKMTLGSTTIGGALKIDTGGQKPTVSGSVQAGEIALDELLGDKDAGPAKSGGSGNGSASGGGKWSREALETGWMHSANLDLSLTAQSITYGGWSFMNPTTKIILKDGTLTVDGLKSGLFGGQALLDAKVQDPADVKQPLSLVVASKMENVALEPLAAALSSSRLVKASGDVSLDFNVQASGLSPYALVSALQGKANMAGTDVVMKGFDLAQIGLAFVDTGKPLDRLSSLVGGATQGGETRFDTVKGAYNIAQGIVQITAMELDGASSNIKSKGSVNLPAWTIDTIHTLTFKQAKEAGAFDVAIKGSLSSPANTFGKGLFQDVLTRRLQQKAIEKLPDVLGDDLTGKLQGLGILPKKQAPVTPTAPAGDRPRIPDPAPAAPITQSPDAAVQTPAPEAAPAQPEAPAPAPQEPAPLTDKQKREQETQKAIQGVLDGLMR